MGPNMTEPSASPPPRSAWWHNWITLAGAVIAGGSLFAFLLLFAITLSGLGQRNPYLAILAYIVAPAFLFLGLALVLGGWWYARRQKLKGASVPPRIVIDLSRPRDRRILGWFGLGTLTFLLLTAVGSYQTYEYTESVQFCGEVCHTVMQPEFVTYNASSHARVACVECHVGSGAASFIHAKVSGLHQVYGVAFNRYPKPIPPPLAVLRPARETCEQCHWPEKYTGNLERTHHRYLADDNNTPYTDRLLIHVGGGSAVNGPVGGIHWHIMAANKVEYYATDDQRQKIPWVRVTGPGGRTTVYRVADFKGEPPPGQIRRMDCIDCHNRPAHQYLSPNDAVDDALYRGAIDPSLKAVKRTAVDLLTRGYKTQDEAMGRLAAGLRQAYGDGPKARAAIAAVQEIYRQNFFPAMKADWSKYPDNIGHLDSTGCFRCHDGRHMDADGSRQMAATDCNTCHTLLAQGAGASLATLAPAGVAFKHPSADIDGLGLLCSDCHNGKNQDN